MKPLIWISIILLAALSAMAQTPPPVQPQTQTPTIADIARAERARKARISARSAWSVKTDDIRSGEPATETAPPEAATGDVAPAQTTEAEAAAVTPEAPDPTQQWYDETADIRAKVRELSDQELAIQLQVNEITNQIFGPQSSQSARDQAQSELQAAQQKLQDVRAELEKGRKDLQARELQGPPKK